MKTANDDLAIILNDLTWRMITILGIQTTVLLGAIYFMLEHWK